MPPRTERIGIAGFQDKVSAAVLNLPVAQRGERFILKLNPPEFKHVVENEDFFLRAAKLSGLNVATARVVTDVDGEAGLLVTRFDRISVDGAKSIALAMEDASQVLGRPPADKYIISTEDAFKALTNICLAPLPAARNFVLLGAHLGLPERAVRRLIKDMSERMDLWLPNIDELPFTAAAKAKFIRHTNYRRKRLSEQG